MLTNPSNEKDDRDQFGLASGRDYTDTSAPQEEMREPFAAASGQEYPYEPKETYGQSGWLNTNKVGQVAGFLETAFDDKPEVGQALETLIIEYPTISRELAAGLAMSGQLTADSALLAELIEIDAQAQASASANRGLTGKMYTGFKSAIRNTFIGAEDIYNNAPFMSAPRAAINLYQGATAEEVWERSTASNAASQQRLANVGIEANYGEGLLPSRELVPQGEGFWETIKAKILDGSFEGSAEEQIVKANQHATVKMALEHGLNPNFFTTNMWETTVISKTDVRTGETRSAPFSPGAAIAMRFTTPGERSYQLFSGSIDAAFRMYGEPVDFVLDNAGDMIVKGLNPKVTDNPYGFGQADNGSNTMSEVLAEELDMVIAQDPIVLNADDVAQFDVPEQRAKGVTHHAVDEEGVGVYTAIDPEEIKRGWVHRLELMGADKGKTWSDPDNIYAAYFIEKGMSPNQVAHELSRKGGLDADIFLTIEHENVHNTVHHEQFEVIEGLDADGNKVFRMDKETPTAQAPDNVKATAQRYVDEDATMKSLNDAQDEVIDLQERARKAQQKVEEVERTGVDISSPDELAEHRHQLEEATRTRDSLDEAVMGAGEDARIQIRRRQVIDQEMRRIIELDAVNRSWNNMMDGTWKGPKILKKFKRRHGLSSIIRPFAQPKFFHEWINSKAGKRTMRVLAGVTDIDRLKKLAPGLDNKDIARISLLTGENADAQIANIYREAFDGGAMGIQRPTVGRIRSTKIRSMDGWALQNNFVGGGIARAAQRQGRRMWASTGTGVLDITDIDATLDTISSSLGTQKIDAAEINKLQRYAIESGNTQTGLTHIEQEMRRLTTERIHELGGGRYTLEEVEKMWDDWAESSIQHRLYWLSPGGRSRNWIWHNSRFKNLDELEKSGIDPEAHLEAQFAATSRVVPDIRRTRRLTSRQRNAYERLRERFDIGPEKGADWEPLGFQSSVAFRAGDAAFGVWRDVQLMRGGWALRILGEEQIRFGASGFAGALSNPLDYIISMLNDLDFVVPGEDITLGDFLRQQESLGAGGLRADPSPLHRVKGGDWKAARRKVTAEVKAFWGGMTREYIQMSRSQLVVLIARHGKEEAVRRLIATDEGREILKEIAIDAAQDSSLGKVANVEQAKQWADTLELRIAELTGGEGLWKSTDPGVGMGLWVDRYDRVVRPASEMTVAELLGELPGGSKGRTGKRKPELIAEVNAERGYNLDELNESGAAAVVIHEGNEDLVRLLADKTLDDIDIRDDLKLQEARRVDSQLEAAYLDREIEPPEVIATAEEELRGTRTGSTYNRAATKIFELLNGVPSQVLNRQPFFQQAMGHNMAVAYFYGDSEFRALIDEMRSSNRSFNIMMELGDSKVLRDMGLAKYPKAFDPIKRNPPEPPQRLVEVIPPEPKSPVLVDENGMPVMNNEPDWVDPPIEAYRTDLAKGPLEPTFADDLDEASGQEALTRAKAVIDPESDEPYKLLDDDFDTVETVETAEGMELELKYGTLGPEHKEVVIALDVEGNVVGSRINGVAGVEEMHRRQGIYSLMLEGQMRNQSLTRADFEPQNLGGTLSGAAAEAANKVFDTFLPQSWRGVPRQYVRSMNDAQQTLDNANRHLAAMKRELFEVQQIYDDALPTAANQDTTASNLDSLQIGIDEAQQDIVNAGQERRAAYEARNAAREEIREAIEIYKNPSTPVGVKPLQPSEAIVDVPPPIEAYEPPDGGPFEDYDVPFQKYYDSIEQGMYDRIPIQGDGSEWATPALFEAFERIGLEEGVATAPRGLHVQRNLNMDTEFVGYPGLMFSGTGAKRGGRKPASAYVLQHLEYENGRFVPKSINLPLPDSDIVRITEETLVSMSDVEVQALASAHGWKGPKMRSSGAAHLPGRATGAGDAPGKYGDWVDVLRTDHMEPSVRQTAELEGDIEQIISLEGRYPDLHDIDNFAETYNKVRGRTRFKRNLESDRDLTRIRGYQGDHTDEYFRSLEDLRVRLADADDGPIPELNTRTSNEIAVLWWAENFRGGAENQARGKRFAQAVVDVEGPTNDSVPIHANAIMWDEAAAGVTPLGDIVGLPLEDEVENLVGYLTDDPMNLHTRHMGEVEVTSLVFDELGIEPTGEQLAQLHEVIERRSYQPDETVLQQEPLLPVARLRRETIDRLVDHGIAASYNRQIGDAALVIDRNLESAAVANANTKSFGSYFGQNSADDVAYRIEVGGVQRHNDSSYQVDPANENIFSGEAKQAKLGLSDEQMTELDAVQTEFGDKVYDTMAWDVGPKKSKYIDYGSEGPEMRLPFDEWAYNPSFRAFGTEAQKNAEDLVKSLEYDSTPRGIPQPLQADWNPDTGYLFMHYQDRLISMMRLNQLLTEGPRFSMLTDGWNVGADDFKKVIRYSTTEPAMMKGDTVGERFHKLALEQQAEIDDKVAMYQELMTLLGPRGTGDVGGFNLGGYKLRDDIKEMADLKLEFKGIPQADRNAAVERIFPGTTGYGQSYDYLETGGFRAHPGARASTVEQVEAVMKTAKASAIDETKFLFYDLAGKSNAADAAKFIFPFGDAFIEVVSRWAAIMNPARSGGQAFRNVRRTTVAANAATRSGFVETNEYGEEVFNWPLAPGMIANMFIPSSSTAQLQASMPIASMLFIDPTAHGIMIPGIGPGIQSGIQFMAPVTEGIPVLHDSLQWLTYGAKDEYRPGDLRASGDLLTSFLPTVMRRLGAAVFQQDAIDSLGNTKMRLFESLMISGDGQFDPLDPDGARKAWDVASHAGTWLGWLRILDSWFLPGQPQYAAKFQAQNADYGDRMDYPTVLHETAKLPYDEQKPIISLLRMQAEFRHARELFGDAEAEMYMIERYGVLPAVLQSTSSGQVDRPVSWGGIEWVNDNKWLEEFAPFTLAGTVPPDADETFSSAAWNNLFSDTLEVDGVSGKPIRASKTALEIDHAIERSLGYDQLGAVQSKYDKDLERLRAYYGDKYASDEKYRAHKKELDGIMSRNKEAIYSEWQLVRGSNQGAIPGTIQGVTNRNMVDELIDLGTPGTAGNDVFNKNVPALAPVVEQYSLWFQELEAASLGVSEQSTAEWWMSAESDMGVKVRQWLVREISAFYAATTDPHARTYIEWINTRLMDQLLDDWEWIDRAFAPEQELFPSLEFTNDNLGFKGALTDG